MQTKLEKSEKALKEMQHEFDKLKKKYGDLKEEHEPCQERLELALKEIK